MVGGVACAPAKVQAPKLVCVFSGNSGPAFGALYSLRAAGFAFPSSGGMVMSRANT